MRLSLYEILVCPECQSALALDIHEGVSDAVHTGTLSCTTCARDYPIRRGIPRFVADDEDYCKNFGWEWARFRHTQVDLFSGVDESERRFRGETEWQPAELKDRLVLDAGCGAGRFTAIACQWGAKIVAVDLSSGSVEVCARNMSELGYEVAVVQASLYRLPFHPKTFDYIFSLGVLHHTPDPKRAMQALPVFLKPGGRLAYWFYEKRWTRFLMLRNYLRGITRHLPLKVTYGLSVAMVSLFFPLTLILSLIPGLRKALLLIPIASRHYWGKLSLRQQWEWTILDTFDSYSPAYEFPQSEQAVTTVLLAVGMQDVHRTAARSMAIVGKKPSR